MKGLIHYYVTKTRDLMILDSIETKKNPLRFFYHSYGRGIVERVPKHINHARD